VLDATRERYVSLASFRRDGREVRTPVWIAADGDDLFVYTNRNSGKVKRIRANGRARLAACDARGRVRGDFVEARAALLEDPAEVERGEAALTAKYGWQLRAAYLVSRLAGRYRDRAIVKLRLEPR